MYSLISESQRGHTSACSGPRTAATTITQQAATGLMCLHGLRDNHNLIPLCHHLRHLISSSVNLAFSLCRAVLFILLVISSYINTSWPRLCTNMIIVAEFFCNQLRVIKWNKTTKALEDFPTHPLFCVILSLFRSAHSMERVSYIFLVFFALH